MINHGTGNLTITLDGRDSSGAVIMRPLADGEWHRIDLIRSGKVSHRKGIIVIVIFGV